MEFSQSFKRVWMLGLAAACLFGSRMPAGGMSRSAAAEIDPNAFVYILGMGTHATEIQYKGLRNGFAVGDGRYVLTAAHCLEDLAHTHDSLFMPIVLSPYYGDAFEAEVVAVDAESDIAVLRPAWQGHPGLEPETGEKWKKSKTVLSVSYPPEPPCRGGNGRISHRVLSEEPRLKRVQGMDYWALQIGPVEYPGPGWSGSPFLNPATGKVVGLLSRQQYLKEFVFLTRHYVYGPRVESIRRLFEDRGLEWGQTAADWPERGGQERFERMVNFLEAMKSGQKDSAQTMIQDLCRDRPESPCLHLLAGWILAPPADRTYFSNTVSLAPESVWMRAYYGRHLFYNNRFSEAAEQFRAVVDRDPNHLFASHGLLATTVNTDPNAGAHLGRELTGRFTEEAALHFEYARTLRILKRYQEELPVIERAVELSKEIPYLYQRHLADSLKQNRRYEEAEQAYRKLLETHECEHCWLAYADLLKKRGRQRAENMQEAIARARSFHADPNTLEAMYQPWEAALQNLLEDPNQAPVSLQ